MGARDSGTEGEMANPVAKCGNVKVFDFDQASAQPGQWVTDGLISYWFEYMTTNHSDDLKLGSAPCTLVEPSTAFLIAGIEPEMAKMIVEALNWCDATLLVAPVNDAPANTSPGGGSHWSTVVYCRATNTFYFMDSSNPGQSLSAPAARTIAAMKHAMGNASVSILVRLRLWRWRLTVRLINCLMKLLCKK